MTEKAFRLDFVIAIAALLVSAASAFALIYQTRVIGDQYAATIWPYLSVDSSYSPHGVTIQVSNDGLGPALIESAQLLVDEKPAASWGTYLYDLQKTHRGKAQHDVSISASNFGRSTTIRPGDTKLLFAITSKAVVPKEELTTHAIGIRVCYCSINSTCWNLVASPGKDSSNGPQTTAACTGNAAISSDLADPSSSPPK